MPIRTALGQSRWSFPVVTINRNTTVTGIAGTDVLTTSAAHNLFVGDFVVFASITGGTGIVVGSPYSVATTPTTTTFTLASLNFTTDLTAPSVIMLPTATTTTLYAPESAKTWLTADAVLTADDLVTTAASVVRRGLRLGLAGGATTVVTNANTVANSGENVSFIYSAGFQARFASDWTSGLSRTCEVYATALNAATGVTAGMTNICVTLTLLYTYQCGDTTITGTAVDDVFTSAVAHNLAVGDWVYIDGLVGGSGATAGTYAVAAASLTATTFTLTGVTFITDITAGTLHFSPVRAKSVPMQLTTPVTSLASSKPGSPTHVIPVLSTEDSGELPERAKTFRNLFIELLGNTVPPSTTDHSVLMEIGTAGSIATNLYEAGLATARFVRYVTSPSLLAAMDTSIANNWFLWASISTTFHHPVATLWITYEYNAKTSTRMRVDQCVTVNPQNAMAGSATPPATNLAAEIWIPEAGTITTLQLALAWTWGPLTTVTGMNARIGTGGYTAYTSGGAGGVFAGGAIAGIRTDGAYTLTRGRNILASGVYRTGGDSGLGLTGFWRVSYTCDVPTAGCEYATKSIVKSLDAQGNGAAATFVDFLTQTLAAMPESTAWRLTNWGCALWWLWASGATPDAIYATLTASANEVGPRSIGAWVGASDDEVGFGVTWFSTDRFVWPWAAYLGAAPVVLQSPSDPTITHTGYFVAAQRALAVAWFGAVDAIYTYHSLAITVNAIVKGSSGSTVEVSLHRGHNRTVTGLTGNAGTDVFTTTTPHWLTVGMSVTITAKTGGDGLALGTYIVGTAPTATTFTLTGGLFTTNITAGTIELPLPRGGEQLAQVSRVGDGAVSLTWYDDTEPVFLVADDMGNAHRKTMSVPFLANSAVTHTLRMLNPPRVIDATIVRKGGS